MKQLTLLCAMAIVLFMACQKENPRTLIVKTESYLPLKVGNYWIYNESTVSDDGIEILTTNNFDSVFIERDTLFNGQLYYKMASVQNNLYHSRFIRDSLHYIVDDKGRKLFSSENFIDTLYNARNNGFELFLKDRFFKMVKEDNVKSTIGVYNCLNYQMSNVLLTPFEGQTARYCNNYYAKNIGIIRKTSAYLFSKSYIREDLIRYKVQ
jgi:hypothetical protein